ncbi:hypothetical protein PAXRUDRAFT_830008 [Paxillus rubicundulus Ve08.2h10]|uniref:DUF6533 domain-containing protein n=1 Tax=Paxillus rubicundulus Ve08.2h10 TaxID=930991 RepID=A0A0D0E4U0_9AGAM|nr:hypothetical protein PAXRUDRAFT_830008 [Paxillus rubicundulus Ve08.2h10]
MESSIDVATELHQQQFAKYMNVAALTAFVFDFCLTFSSEVYHVWGRKWDITRIVFTVSRYLSIITSALTFYDVLHSKPCSAYVYFIDVITYGCMVSVEVILILRTYALWEHSRRVLIVLLALAVVFIIAATVTWSNVKFSLPGDPEDGNLCGSGAPRNAGFICLFLVAYEIVLQSMNTWKKFRAYRNVQSQILNTLYWDGIMYMFWIIILMAAVMLVKIAAPMSYFSSLDTAQVALQSVFASRIFFNLRECDEHIRRGGSVTAMSLNPLQFSPHSVSTTQSRVEDSAS